MLSTSRCELQNRVPSGYSNRVPFALVPGSFGADTFIVTSTGVPSSNVWFGSGRRVGFRVPDPSRSISHVSKKKNLMVFDVMCWNSNCYIVVSVLNG